MNVPTPEQATDACALATPESPASTVDRFVYDWCPPADDDPTGLVDQFRADLEALLAEAEAGAQTALVDAFTRVTKCVTTQVAAGTQTPGPQGL